MTEFEKALQDCLRDLELGNSSIAECLSRHPKYAGQLEPILRASAYLERAGEIQVSESFKERVRAKLLQQMQVHPRKPRRGGPVFMRLVLSMAAVLLALLATGTVYAQGALPGNAFYSWKIASENAWRTVSPDPVKTDLAIVDRRANELMVVKTNPALASQVLKAYLEVADRLKSESDEENKGQIRSVLDAQTKKLNRSGITISQPEHGLPPKSNEPIPTLTAMPLPTATPPAVVSTPTALPSSFSTPSSPQTPQAYLTATPEATLTLPVPTEGISTVGSPVDVTPTIETEISVTSTSTPTLETPPPSP